MILFVRVGGIEPPSQPWEGRIIPLNYTRLFLFYHSIMPPPNCPIGQLWDEI